MCTTVAVDVVAVVADVIKTHAVAVFVNVVGAYVIQANAVVISRNLVHCGLDGDGPNGNGIGRRRRWSRTTLIADDGYCRQGRRWLRAEFKHMRAVQA